MGLKNGQQIIGGLQKVAPGAFKSRVYPEHGYKTFAVDLMSLMHSLMSYCRNGHELLGRLKLMLQQHKKCSEKKVLAPGEVENKKIVSVIALEDYSETPKNKEIERDSRIDADTNVPYSDAIELHTNGESTVVDFHSYEYETLDTFFPKDFGRVRSTPILMRKLLRFLCKIISENVTVLTNADPNHVIVVDGFRDYTRLSANDNENVRGSEASEKIGIWRSDTHEVSEKSKIGEGEVKAVNWAINYNQFGGVLVHSNDGDLLMLLCVYSMRVPFTNLVTGVMSQSYLYPMHDGKTPVSEEETKKVFCPGTLSIAVYERINSLNTTGIVLPQTYFLFLMMCGNDYVESLPGIGPAKLMNILTTRRPGLLDRAVTFVVSDSRVAIEVDEKAILDTLVLQYSTLLDKANITADYLAAWIRRVVWTLDYHVNAPLGNEILDPCARKDGLSCHGYQLNDKGRCVIDNEVYEPTLVRIPLPSDEMISKKTIKRTGVIFEEAAPDGPRIKRSRQHLQSSQQKEQPLEVPSSTAQSQSIEKKEETLDSSLTNESDKNFHAYLAKTAFAKTPRENNIAQLRHPIPFGKITK